MKLFEAVKTLKGKLIFGDDARIKAVRFMEEFEEVKEARGACKNLDEHLNFSPFENSDDIVSCVRDACDCLREGLRKDAVAEALRSLKSERNAGRKYNRR